jgi:hypothetical protein
LLSVYKHLLKEREKNPSLPVKQALLPVAQQLRDFKTMADAYVPNETTEQKALKSFLTGMASFSTIVLTRAIQGESFKSIVELIRASSFPKAKASA